MQNNPALFERIHAVWQELEQALELLRRRKERLSIIKKQQPALRVADNRPL